MKPSMPPGPVQTPSLPALLTVPEAADYLRVSTRTVRRMIAVGTLPATWIGRSVRVRSDRLTHLLVDE